MRTTIAILCAAAMLLTAGAALAGSTKGHPQVQLPGDFEGCWEGTFVKPDKYAHLGGPPVGQWVPVTYQLCFKPNRAGIYQATFQRSKDESIDAQVKGLKIVNFQSTVRIVGTDGKKTANLDIEFSFDQPSGARTAHMSASNSVQCLLSHNPLIRGGKILLVNLSQTERCDNIPDIKCDGQPWLSSKWHTQFHPVVSHN